MADEKGREGTKAAAETKDIESPRLTPQGRADGNGGEDATAPDGKGAKSGQPDKAEG